MNNARDRLFLVKGVPLIAAFIVAVTAALVMYGWWIKSVVLVQISPHFSPMQFNTALLFFLSASGLTALFLRRPHLAAGLGMFVLLFALATLLQYLVPVDFKIDQLFMKAFTAVKTSNPGRMSPQAALNFILTGFCLLAGARRTEFCRKASLFMATCILTLALSALLGYAFKIESAYGWGSLTRMAMHTSVCFCFIAVGLMALNWLGEHRFWPAVLVFFSGLFLSLCVLQIMSSAGEAHTRTLFLSDARDRVLAFQRQLDFAHRTLHGLRAFYEGSKSVEREEFGAFVHRALEGVQSIQATEWVENLPEQDRPAFEGRLRAEGFEHAFLKELAENGEFIPAKSRPVYYPVTYTEPFQTNKIALGFDHGSDAPRKAAIERARDENISTVTAPLRLFRELDQAARGILIFEPVYKSNSDAATPESRRRSFAGVLMAVIRFPLFIDKALAFVTIKPLQFYLVDITNSSQPVFAYASDAVLTPRQLEQFARTGFDLLTGLYHAEKLAFGGREYLVLIHADSLYLSQHHVWYPTATFFLMLMLSLAATFFVMQAMARSFELERFTSELGRARDASEIDRSNLKRLLTQLEGQQRAMNQSVIVSETDAQGHITYVNDEFCRVSKYSRHELLGQDHRIVNSGYHPKAFFKEMWAVIGSGKIWRGEVRNRAKDGSYYWVDATIAPLLDGQGKIEKYLSIRVVITERKQVEEELRKASQAALEASRAKSEFLATMSHEIRTPMNAILGMAELLSETPLNEDQLQYVRTLSRGGETLLSLINDVLDLSKIESGVIEIDNIDYSVKEITERVVEVLAIAAHRKKIELTTVIPHEIPEVIEGDPARVRQILMNLIGNAIKFTEKGEVNVELEQTGNELQFSVRDTGIGIAEDKLEKIFNPFTQADSSTTRKYGGTGLGLSISKKLVELMGGKIWAESRPGEGSHFYFTLPLRVPAALPEGADGEAPEILRGRKVLIVDDSTTNRLIVSKAVLQWGMTPSEAVSGRECLEMIKAKALEGIHFDLILMDCRMPDMGGFDVAKKLRESPERSMHMIVMLTSDSRSGDMETAKKLGFEAFLIKPIRRTELLKAICSVFLKKKLLPEAIPAVLKTAPAPAIAPVKKILLAEDAPDNQELVKAFLKNEPYVVEVAENGKVALEKAVTGSYDLILMDMQMPEMDGYMATQLIRARGKKDARGSRLPIVALTANALTKDAEKCLAAGCDAYLAKPIKKAVLLEALAGYFSPKTL